MNKQFLFLPAILVVVLIFSLILFANLVTSTVSGQAAYGSRPVQQVALTATPMPVDSGDEIPPGAGGMPSNPNGTASTNRLKAGGDELPPANLEAGIQAPSAFPTPIPGETLVYFVAADSDATATVLFLYNTDAVSHIVALRGYSYNGVLGYSLNININANSFLRLSSDSVAAAPPPSWATPAPIITNFTDFTYLVSLSLPKGVKVEGYVIFNPGTGIVNPRLDQGAIPLRFSSDPATVLLPTVLNGP